MSGKLKFNCSQCDKVFYRYPCEIRPGTTNVCCSMKCVGLSKRHGSDIKCFWCGRKFYRRFGEQDAGERENQFCSSPCYFSWREYKSAEHVYKKQGGRHIHRIVAESVLGRKLKKGEVVHHIDSNKKNNHPNNLAVLPSQSIHSKLHLGKISEEEIYKYYLVKR